MRSPFFLKILAVAVSMGLLTVAVANVGFVLSTRHVLVSGLGKEAVALAIEAAGALDPAGYAALVEGRAEPEAVRDARTAEVFAVQESLGPRGAENVYVLGRRDDALYVLADPSGDDPAFVNRDEANLPLKFRILDGAPPAATPEPYSDQWGTWMSGYAPLVGPAGDRIALVGVDLPLGAFPLMGRIITENVLLSVIPALLIAGIGGVALARRMSRPVAALTSALERVRDGDYDTRIESTSRDEIGRMASAFNAMASELADKERIRSVFDSAVSREVAEAMLSGNLKVEGEIREVTVLFADIRGFTALSEQLSAREIIATLNEYLAAMAPLVSENGGVIDKFVGDEIFAVFGAPTDHEDDAMAAIRTALAMRDALRTLNERRVASEKAPIRIGIGLSTGTAVAGNMGSSDRMNYTVLGPTVNVGARLCASADPGQIIINETAYLRVKSRIEARPLAPLTVKGVTFPLTVFEVAGLRDDRDSDHAPPGVKS